ncbi:hypothetical protein RFI_17842 [Reticulomyxa filosa]|uniref:Uncharacterized protein n=1 Tax=Reticulomyxa filosa TaxID=46433 RepID=X6N034_RETFI|nr:hypothetical protein RFI_17842 [Reticulomyxa filosa]|eukprot:ETO19391.1 hypothetical protein RFI_17842 [Reticulomyxa filosa]
MLVEHGANVNHRDAMGRTALHYAIHAEGEAKQERKKDFQKLIALILKNSPNLEAAENKFRWTPIFQAVRGGNVAIVSQLANMNANLDSTDYKGNSLLHVAMDYNKPKVLEDWNFQHKNNDGDTPLRLGVMKGHTECIKILAIFEDLTTQKKALLLAVKTDQTQVLLSLCVCVCVYYNWSH